MELVIAIIIIVWAVHYDKKKKQKRQKPVSKPNVPRQTRDVQTRQQELKQRREQTYGNTPGQTRDAQTTRQQESKRRSEQTYGNVPVQTRGAQTTRQQESKRRSEQAYRKFPDKPQQDQKNPPEAKDVSDKYSRRQQWDGKQPEQSTYDLLSRADANAREETSDKRYPPKDMLPEEPADFFRTEEDGDGDLLRQVNDLIVMGYPVKLSYERDFLAEGIQMMNQYQSMNL